MSRPESRCDALHHNRLDSNDLRAWRILAYDLERLLSLAQTEIKGHMRVIHELGEAVRRAQADERHATYQYSEAQARIAELEEALAIYADSQNFVGGNDWYWVGDDDPTLAAKKALKSRA